MRVPTIGKLLTRMMALAVFAVGGLLFISPATAALLVRDSFTYPDGNLVGNTPEIGGVWTNHSGTTTILVSSGAALVDSSKSEDAHTDFVGGAIGAGDKIYAAFDLTINDPGVAVGNTYFAHFKDAGNFFGARVWATAPTTSGYRLALSNDSSITDGDDEAFWGSDLAFGTTYRVVTSYDYDSGATQLWIDPASEASTSIASPGFANDAFENYSLRQSTGSTISSVDELCVATSFNQALNCVPEPSTVALVLFAFGLVGLCRRTTR